MSGNSGTESKLYVRNWAKFQHYKNRCPPWIKLATDTFQNYEFSRLQDASKLLAIGIWTLASRCNSLQKGAISCDFNYIKSQLALSDEVKPDHLQELIDKGFLTHSPPRKIASKLLAPCKQNACLETEAETEYKKPSPLSPPLQGGEKNAAFAAEQKLQNATAWVCQELGLAGRDIRNVVAAALEQEAKTSTEEIQTIAEIMVRSRRSYDAHPRGSFHALPSKFFAEGIWKASREYTQHSNPADVPRPRPVTCMMPGCDKPARDRDRFCSDVCKGYAQKIEQNIHAGFTKGRA